MIRVSRIEKHDVTYLVDADTPEEALRMLESYDESGVYEEGDEFYDVADYPTRYQGHSGDWCALEDDHRDRPAFVLGPPDRKRVRQGVKYEEGRRVAWTWVVFPRAWLERRVPPKVDLDRPDKYEDRIVGQVLGAGMDLFEDVKDLIGSEPVVSLKGPGAGVHRDTVIRVSRSRALVKRRHAKTA